MLHRLIGYKDSAKACASGKAALLFGVLGFAGLLSQSEPCAGQASSAPTEARVFSTGEIEIWAPTISKDGEWIVFDGHPSPTRRSLFVVPADGGKARHLTSGPFHDGHPSWSPDGRHVYFYSDRASEPGGHIYHLMRVPVDPSTGEAAGPPRVVSFDDAYYSRPPAVSPDGQWVAYIADLGGPRPNHGLRIVPAQGGPSRELARLSFGNFGWSADGRHVLYSESNGEGKTGLFRVPMAGGAPERLLSFGEGNYLVSVSGNGERLLWSRSSTSPDQVGARYEVTDVTGTIHSVLDDKGNVAVGSLSYDGSTTFYSTVDRERSLVVTPLSGGETRVLVKGEPSCSNSPQGWTEDGRLLVVTTCGEGSERTQTARFVHPRDGSSEPVTLPEEAGSPGLIHPDGRHLQWRVPTRDESNPLRRYFLPSIVDLQTGEFQEVPPDEIRGILNGPGGIAIDDGAFLHQDRGPEGIRILKTRPGESPVPFWTYPEDLVSEGFRGAPRVEGVGVHGDRVAWIRSNYDGDLSIDLHSTLFVTDVDRGTTETILEMDARMDGPMWSPNGRRIALNYFENEEAGWKIMFLEVDDGLNLVGEPFLIDDGDYSYLNRLWTPDSRALIESGIGVTSAADVAVFLLPAEPGGEAINLSKGETEPWYPASLSPDGSWLVFPSHRLVGSSIWRMDLGGIPGGSPH